VFPFSDPETFNIEISQPWQESDQQGLLRLKKLVNSVALCRPRAAINLPSRTDEIHRLTFTAAEQELYNSALTTTADMLDNAMSEDFTQKGLYLNALTWLNKLRLICNHGVVAGIQESFDDMNTDSDVPNTWDNITAQKAFNSMIDAGAAMCVACTANLADTTSDGSPEGNVECLDNGIQPPIHARLSQCLFVLCCSCASKASALSGKSPCAHHPKCLTFEVSLVESSHPQILNSGITMSPGSTPTKLKALLQNLKEFKTEKRYVNSPQVTFSIDFLIMVRSSAIFSYWTFTLDLIECVLNRASIRFTRIDGQLSPEKRADAIRRFQTTDDVRIILVSITCGGAG
jgi:SNF2 family DNA or RNA helicase